MRHSNNDYIQQRFLVKGDLELLSPLLLGTGHGADTDLEILRDGTGRPFIPGTSWAGVLRSLVESEQNNVPWTNDLVKRLFGFSNQQDGRQSQLITYDLPLSQNDDPQVEVRHNVALDEKTRTAGHGKLFDYEVLTANQKFDFTLELVLRAQDDQQGMLRLVTTLLAYLQSGRVRLGAKTRSGYGQVKLNELEARLFDLREEDDRTDWFSGRRQLKPFSLDDWPYKPAQFSPYLAEIKGRFYLDGPLMISMEPDPEEAALPVKNNEGNSQSKEPDAVQLQSGGKPIISGTALKGAIRHQLFKIMHTMDPEHARERLVALFGKEGEPEKEDQDKKPARAGRLTVSEAVIEGKYTLPDQMRTRIDYLTGSVLETALIHQRPVWSERTAYVDLVFQIESGADWEVAWLLQALKDLWTGWLTIGGSASIGRGRLRGETLEILHQKFSEPGKITRTEDGIKIDNPEVIWHLDAAWQRYLGGEQ